MIVMQKICGYRNDCSSMKLEDFVEKVGEFSEDTRYCSEILFINS